VKRNEINLGTEDDDPGKRPFFDEDPENEEEKIEMSQYQQPS
jgi:hypothetical protein